MNIFECRSINSDSSSAFFFIISLLRLIISSFRSISSFAILQKSPNSGCDELRSAIRNYLARNRGIYVDTEQIIIGAGVEYLYRLIIELITSGVFERHINRVRRSLRKRNEPGI